MFNFSFKPFLIFNEIKFCKYNINEFVIDPGIENKAKLPIYLKNDLLLEDIIDFTIFPFISAIYIVRKDHKINSKFIEINYKGILF